MTASEDDRFFDPHPNLCYHQHSTILFMYIPKRKITRLAPHNYLGFHFYFITICCFKRQNIFTAARHCAILAFLQQECNQRHFALNAYCVMPDHLHFLCEGLQPTSDLLHFLTSFRIKTSRYFARNGQGAVWQRGFYDHILRENEPAQYVAWYIWLNPVRKQLVSKPQEYPFAGSLTGWQMPSSWDAPHWTPPWK
jgi:putative transposase